MILDKEHTKFEQSCIEWLKANHFIITSAAYHDVMDEKTQLLLSRRDDLTSLYVRTRADRIIMHNHQPLTFEVEFKTHKSKRRGDMTVEMLPLSHHLAKSQLGVECLYVYRDICNKERGFWIRNLPRVRWICIPDRWDDVQSAQFEAIAHQWFPGVSVSLHIHVNGGSQDPFAVIDQSIVKTIPDWHELILNRIAIPFDFLRDTTPRERTAAEVEA